MIRQLMLLAAILIPAAAHAQNVPVATGTYTIKITENRNGPQGTVKYVVDANQDDPPNNVRGTTTSSGSSGENPVPGSSQGGTTVSPNGSDANIDWKARIGESLQPIKIVLNEDGTATLFVGFGVYQRVEGIGTWQFTPN